MIVEEPAERLSLVVNGDGDTGLWPAGRPVPAGWHPVGFTASREESLREIERRAADTEPARRNSSTGETLVSMFDLIADRYPDRIATSDERRSLTYAELRQRAKTLSSRLVARGVRPGDRMVIYLDRGVHVFISMLAILNAGAAYVAIDTRYPDARRDLMINASRPTMIVTEAGWAEQVAPLGFEVIEWAGGEDDPPVGQTQAVDVGPRDAACVLFTSGSTGAPKAIVLEHRNLLYFARNSGLAELRAGDRVGQMSSLSFDAFHFESWHGFAQGVEVVVLPTMAESISNDLRRELSRRRITVLIAPTMAVNHVVYEDQDAFAPLRLLYTGGDVLQPDACRQLLAGSFAGDFYNLYGPAEGTTACTGYRVNALADDASTVPIGEPLSGAGVYLLDSTLDHVAPGSVGEIYIGGEGVARGYLDQPALTAERFPPDPFGVPGTMMYATGDLGRQGPGGQLEFVGRVDDQVKIRGYRVEPREVELAVSSHPSVRDTAVIAVGAAHDRRLVALVVQNDSVPPSRLRQHAAELLPDYMVPLSFVRVQGIPSNDHGKRDMGRLEELASNQVERQNAHVPPSDEIEKYLADAWEDMLCVEWISRADDFFALGGNSLLAFRLQRRIQRDLNVTVGVEDVLATSQLADLGDLIRKHREAG